MGVAYNSRIVTDGLVLCLDAGNSKSYPGSGTTWTDLSGNGVIGTLSATNIGYDSANGGSLSFDGTDDFVTYNMANPFAETVIVWAKSATTNWNENGWMSSARGENGHLIHPVANQKTVQFYVGNPTPNPFIGTGTPDNIMIPHMYSYNTNGTNLHIAYIDATEVARSTESLTFPAGTRNTTPSSSTSYLGKDSTLTRWGNGNIYSCLRYNRALTATEIAQNYDALKGRYGLT